MATAFGMGVLVTVLLSADSPNVAGEWSGDGWGSVVLTQTDDTQYTATYNDTFGKVPGQIQLKWSTTEHRFNGTWRDGESRFGELSLRFVDGEIRGAYTTDSKSKINPGVPRLADFRWRRTAVTSQWGEEVEGVSVGLRAERDRWRTDQAPLLRADIRNEGTLPLETSVDSRLWRLEVDGIWYCGPISGGVGAGFDEDHPLNELPVQMSPLWRTCHPRELDGAQYGGGGIAGTGTDFERRPLTLEPGKHTVRLAVFALPTRVTRVVVVRAFSNPIEIEIKPVQKP